MTIITLDEAKAHLRVDGDADDADITLKLMAAEGAVAESLNRSVPWTDEAGAEVPVPAPVKAAVLLILGDLYATREAAVTGTIRTENQTVEWLLSPYRKWSFA
ncbi:head-tail connector protein [Azospirillum sp.]|uniref:head-tail connector protein n=1 Tax=Azospirillum sp. TaxID=34012 RepID=UPI002D71EF70|nr:head-tail connector protein [Azospirillum sp.]HYF87422.1 head-tail connector protein [Azospirillum sp.]